MRQGGDPRLPLELALVKVTQPEHDLSREALLQRIERLEARPSRGGATASSPPPPPLAPAAPQPALPPVDDASEADAGPVTPAPPEASSLDLEQLRQAWDTAVVGEVEKHSIPAASVLREARPAALEAGRLVIEFPPSASFHRNLAEEPKNAELLAEVLEEITGARLALDFAIGQPPASEEDGEEPAEEAGEEQFVSLFKDTFDARELRPEE
jgi:DNA polymerase-3 subunit gamma/tau